MGESAESTPRLHIESPLNGPAGYTSGSDGDIHVGDYLRVLHRRRWTLLAAFSIVVVSTAVWTFTAVPIYEAKATMLIETANQNIVNIKEVVQESQDRGDYYQTQYNMLQSRTLARKTLDELHLWPGSAGGTAKPVTLPTTSTLSRARAWLRERIGGAAAVPVEPRVPDETRIQSAAIDAFAGGLLINPVKNSRLVDVQYQSPDPVLAAKIVNTLTRLYIEQSLEFKFLSSKEASDWLALRLGEQRKNVEASEAALQRYRETNDAVSLEERQNIVVQKLTDLNSAVTRAKTVRIEKESLYNQLRSVQNDRAALDSYPAILSNGYIQGLKTNLADLQRQYAQLSQSLGDKHPDMRKLKTAMDAGDAKLQGEIGKVVQAVHTEYLTVLAQERSLVEALDAQKREALSLNRRGIDYGVLRRDAESNRQIFDSLMQRAKETGVSSELKTSNIRIVDPAETPRSAISPRSRFNMSLALFGGALFGIGLAFFFEYVDNRIKTPEEIRTHLRLPFLGLIPSTGSKTSHSQSPLLNNGVPPRFVEAFRAIRTNILFSSAEEGSRSIVITSSGPNEGKTVVAANLAIGLAQSGQRVLLIDADMRRPRIHQVFEQLVEPGLSNLLVGTSKASEAVRKTSVSGLWLLPAGRVPPNPAELLGSKRFKDFLATLAEHFDWVILDTPPIMAVTDAAVIAHMASGVVFVVGAEMTSRGVARNALDQLASAQAKFIGAVLNRVDLEHNAYYYSQYYRCEYAKYYATDTTS